MYNNIIKSIYTNLLLKSIYKVFFIYFIHFIHFNIQYIKLNNIFILNKN